MEIQKQRNTVKILIEAEADELKSLVLHMNDLFNEYDDDEDDDGKTVSVGRGEKLYNQLKAAIKEYASEIDE